MKTIQTPTQINFLDERFYTLDFETFKPSVTFVLDSYPKGAGFNRWLKNLGSNADQVLEDAGIYGTKFHNAANALLKGEKLEWNDEIYNLELWKSILNFQTFWQVFQPKLVDTECIAFLDEFDYAGTLDLVCEIKGEIWLIDLKTSNALREQYWLQLAAYANLWNNLHKDKKIQRRGIFWTKAKTRGIDKTGKKIQGEGWQIIESPHSFEDDFELFEAVLKIFKREHPVLKPKNYTLPVEISLK